MPQQLKQMQFKTGIMIHFSTKPNYIAIVRKLASAQRKQVKGGGKSEKFFNGCSFYLNDPSISHNDASSYYAISFSEKLPALINVLCARIMNKFELGYESKKR